MKRKWIIFKFFRILLTKPDEKGKLLKDIEKVKGVLQKFAQFLYLQDNEKYECFKALLDNGRPYPDKVFSKCLVDLGRKGVAIDLGSAKCGSLGQIYKGTYSGSPVIVKCLLPGIVKETDIDISFMKKAVSRIFKIFRLPNDGVLISYICEFERIIKSETDYAQEIINTIKFKSSYSKPDVFIPKIIEHLSGEGIIVEEMCSGIPIEDFLKTAAEGDKKTVINTLFNFYSSLLFKFGLLHGDPHFGNFFVRRNRDKIILEVIDFGCIKVYEPSLVNSFVNLITALRVENNEEAFRQAAQLGFKPEELNLHKPVIIPLLYIIFEPFLTDEPFDFGQWRLNYAINTLMSSKNIDGVLTMPKDMLILFRVFNGCLAYLNLLDEAKWNVYSLVI